MQLHEASERNLRKSSAWKWFKDVFIWFPLFLLPLLFDRSLNDPWNGIRLPLMGLGLLFGGCILWMEKASLQLPTAVWAVLAVFMGFNIWGIVDAPDLGDALLLGSVRIMAVAWMGILATCFPIQAIAKPVSVFALISAFWGILEWIGWVDLGAIAEGPTGFTGNPNTFGCLMAMSIPMFWLGWADGLHGKWIRYLGSGMLMLAVFASGSLAAYLAVVAGGVAWAGISFLKTKRLKVWGAAWMLGLILFPVFLASLNLDGSVRSDAQSNSATERFMLWRNTLEIIGEEPILGTGLGGWKQEMLARGITGYSTDYATRYFTEPHNDFLWVAAETGIISGLAYIAWLVWLGMEVCARAGQGNASRARYAWLGAGLSAWIITSDFGFPLERIDMTMVGIAIMGSVLADRRVELSQKPRYRGDFAVIIILGAAPFTWFGFSRIEPDRKLGEMRAASKAGQWQTVLELGPSAEKPWHHLEYFSSTPVSFYLGNAHMQLRQFVPAKIAYQAANRQSPFHPHVLHNLAAAHAQLGELDSAFAVIQQCVNYHPDFKEAKETEKTISAFLQNQ